MIRNFPHAQAMAACDKVQLVEVFEDGELVASHLGLLADRGALTHTLAIQVGGRLKGPGHVVQLAVVEAAMSVGAEVIDRGRGGLPGDPKIDLGPRKVPFGTFQAARSPAMQRALEGTLRLLATARVVHSRFSKMVSSDRSAPTYSAMGKRSDSGGNSLSP